MSVKNFKRLLADRIEELRKDKEITHYGAQDLMSIINESEEYLERIRANIRQLQASIETSPNYWDCECTENYIHPKTVANCRECGADRDESPDSRKKEVTK